MSTQVDFDLVAVEELVQISLQCIAQPKRMLMIAVDGSVGDIDLYGLLVIHDLRVSKS